MCPCHPNESEFVYVLLAAAAFLVGVSLMRKYWTRMHVGLRIGGVSALIVLVGLLGYAVVPNAATNPESTLDPTSQPAIERDSPASPAEGGTLSQEAVWSEVSQPDMGHGGKVAAYYFHRTVRCRSCLTIEALSKQVIEEKFQAELAGGLLEYRAVNIDKPENQHFESEYDLTVQSLVLVRIENGQQTEWKNLEKVWDLFDDDGAFREYVQTEVSGLLDGGASIAKESEAGY